MPHDAQTIRQDFVPSTNKGAPDRVTLTIRESPCGPNGEIGQDLREEWDIWAAGEAMKVLNAEYPDHLWRVIHDSAQGVCLISIPILMGVNHFMAVNLKTHALDSRRVKLAGGEILERYGLKRGRFEEAPFLDARAKHSALVVPGRPVPG
jgi:hypothetical protein